MIKFFRKIRKKLLADLPDGKAGNPPNGRTGKFGSYLIYAFGEIILVVIGILIALSVNNWNQEKKDRKTGEEYLARIHRDLVQDTTNFRRILISNKILREDIKGLLVSIYAGVDNIKQVQEMSKTFDDALDQVFITNDNTYKGMASSGALNLIHNMELKDEIVDLYSEYEQNKALLSSISEWMISIVNRMDSETDFLKFGQGVSDIFTTPEMLNEKDFAFINNREDPKFKILIRAISAAAFNQSVYSSYYHKLIKRSGAVLKRIDQELKK
jgi:hypothetical protein|tara:strand:- start:7333 stop:8142 length:810 start_codon:yes stop_codon:yes gene_type:complete